MNHYIACIFYTVSLLCGLFFVILTPPQALAAPSISGVNTSNGTSDGNSVTISGTNFGTRVACGGPPHCAWVRDWANSVIDQGNWNIESNAGAYSLSSAQARPGHANALLKSYNGNRLGAYSYYMTSSPNQWFISFWFKLKSPITQSGKFFRIYGNSPDNIYLSTGYEPGNPNTEVRGFSEALSPSPPPSTLWGSPDAFGYGTWKRVDILVQSVPSSLFTMWMNRAVEVNLTNWVPTPFSTSGHTIDVPNMIDDPASSGGADGSYVYSDMYVSQSQARVELCSAATWSACSDPEIQLLIAWSTTSATIQLNTLGLTGTKYLYICDSTGACNATGSALTLNGGSDTTAPTTPSNPSAEATSSTSIHLIWTASTDNVGVTGYKIERCQHHGCSSFSQVGTSITASFTDTVPQPTAYQYRIRASDAAANDSAYSSSVDVAAPTAPEPFDYGIAAGYEIRQLNPTDRAHQIADFVELGVRWVRFDMTHSTVEGTQGVFDWSLYDGTIADLTAAGIKVLPILLNSPAWNRDPGAPNSSAPPTSVAAFANFVTAAVTRYKAQVHAWEVWNEPNLTGFWYPARDPVAYTTLLKAVYNAIKLEDPTATVITAGVAQGTIGNADSGVKFIEDIYANGGKHYFDAVGYHPYSYPDIPSDPSHLWNGYQHLASTTPNVRGVMTANGDTYKKIWPTEWGAPTLPWIGSQAQTQQAQADNFVTSMYVLLRAQSWTGPSFYYTARDSCTDTANKECWFGLVFRDWSRKTSFNAYKFVATPPAAPTGLGVE